jgi:hypothetical protein
MAHRNRWFTELKNGEFFHGYVKCPIFRQTHLVNGDFNMCGLLPHRCWSIPTRATSILVEQGQVEPFAKTLIFLEKRPDQLIVSRSLKYTQCPALFGIIISNNFHTATFFLKRPHPRFWDWRHKPQILKPTYHVWSPKLKLNGQYVLPKDA